MNKQRYFWYTRVLKSMFWSITLSQSNWEKKCNTVTRRCLEAKSQDYPFLESESVEWMHHARCGHGIRVHLSLPSNKFFFFFDWGICAIASARLKHKESVTKSKSPLREKRQIGSVSLSTFIRQQTGTVDILLNLSHHFKIIPTEIVVNWLI